MPHATTVDYLKFGDRFYFTSDKKKSVWQVTSNAVQTMKLRGVTHKIRVVQKAIGSGVSNGNNKNALVTTNVVLLRNVYEEMRDEAQLFIQE